MLRQAAYDPRRLDEYLEQIDQIDPAKLKEYEQATGIALARSMWISAPSSNATGLEERRLMPRYVEAQFLAAAKEIGLRVEARADGLWRWSTSWLICVRTASFVGRFGKRSPPIEDHLPQAASGAGCAS